MDLYGNLQTCPKCKMIHKKLQEKGIDFNFIDNEEEVMKVAKKYGIMGIPFAIQDGKVLQTNDLMKLGMNVK